MFLHVDKLTFSVCLCLLPYLLRYKKVELLCVYSSGAFAHFFVFWAGKIFRTRITVSTLFSEMGGLRHENGRSLRYVVDDDVCRTIMDHERRLLRTPDPIVEFLSEKCPKTWVVRCISHSINDEVRTFLRALYVLRAHIRDNTPDRGVVLINWSPWVPVERCAEFCGNMNLRSCGVVSGLLYLFLKAGVLYAGFLLHGLWGMFFRAKRPENKSGLRLVAAQYCWGRDLDNRSDVYWLRGGHVRVDQTLLYFNRPDTPLTPELAEKLNEQGFQRLVCPKGRLSGHALVSRVRKLFRGPEGETTEDFHWYPSRAWGKELVGRLFRLLVPILRSSISRRVSLGQGLDIAGTACALVSEVNYWKHFFTDNGAAMHTNHSGDTGWMHTAQTLALEEIGGVNFRSNYSYVHGVDVNYAREFQFYFAWGAAPRCEESLEHFHTKYLFVSGYPFDHMFRRELDPVSNTGEGSFRLTVFDESCGPYASFSSETIRDFYDMVAHVAAENPNIEIFIKPKIYLVEDILSYCPSFQEVLDSKKVTLLPPTIRPCEAAADADLVLCLGHNSAGVEAALTGCKVICWIHDGHTCPQLDYADSMINFHSRKEIREAVRIFVSGSSESNKIGDFSSIIDQIDPFRDGKAAERVGRVLACWLEEQKRTGSSDAAAKACVEEYEKLYGSDLVRSAKIL